MTQSVLSACVSLVGDERHAAIEPAARLADNHQTTIESRVQRHIRHHEDVGAADRRCAQCSRARWLDDLRRQTMPRLEPAPIVVDRADSAYGAAANLCGKFGDFVIGDFRRRIEDMERVQSSQPMRFVGRCRERLRGSLQPSSTGGLSYARWAAVP
jgi:hypothetical protein